MTTIHSPVVPTSVPVLGEFCGFHERPGSAFLPPYPTASAGDPDNHGNHPYDSHRRTGRDAGRDGGTGSGDHEQFDGSDFPVAHPEAGHPPVSYTHLRAHETRHDLVC